jgi:hypothetical protein
MHRRIVETTRAAAQEALSFLSPWERGHWGIVKKVI